MRYLSDEDILEIARVQTNHRAIEMMGDTFLRIGQAVAREYEELLSDDIIEALKLDGRWPMEE